MNKSANNTVPPKDEGAPPELRGESQWIMRAITNVEATMKETKSDLQGNMNDLKTELRDDMDALKKPMRRIERMLWSIIGAAALILLLFDDEILAFVRNLLSSQQ